MGIPLGGRSCVKAIRWNEEGGPMEGPTTGTAPAVSLLGLYPPWGPRTMRRLPEGVEAAPYERFVLRPQSPTIGAEIEGVDLSVPLEDGVKAEIHRALLEWKVLVFCGQDLSPAGVERFASEWGEPYDATLRPTEQLVTGAYYA